ncbi:hypothetical protein EST38_g8369 [Candolleomyces aberdarensis]|uniref:DDE-1 domain-containing protein n=1 Tax=Candolleomyces aberdarensis TaxID=2316362 RepID=A0A4Q2DFI9_9AGAR|nr:hypothetical protein EST38_g8369 [Candolleomyces aberdarensis]
MPGRALSKEEKKRRLREITEKWTERAVNAYKYEKTRPLEPGKTRKGLRAISEEFKQQCLEEDKVLITIDKTTISRRLNGVPSQADANFDKNSWLSRKEEKALVKFALACADQGFPWDVSRLEEYANDVCLAKYGDDFPGLGQNWGDRFVGRHQGELKPCWSHALDHQRARAANPVTKKEYFTLLKKAIEGEEGEEAIPEELIYGVHETGIQCGVGQKRRVLGRAEAKIQQQQRSGDRENITVIVTICADGSDLPPAVIFKGKTYRTSWRQNNPLKASLGHSEKGWTDGEIGVEWMKEFDRQTKAKANGRRRLLLVDGHNSHYTAGFLRHAQDNNILVLCYPSHSTHIYQGLDVVIFSPLKTAWTEAWDEYERRTGQKVNKQCFLEVYANAHMKALSKQNIISAFRVTGVVPLNPDVITETMLAPSRTSSTSSSLPVPLPSPTQALSDTIHALIARQARSEDEGMDSDSGTDNERDVLPHPQMEVPARRAIDSLQGTSASFLVSRSPLTSQHELPRYQPYTISPFQQRYQGLLDLTPATENERRLQEALREVEQRDRRRKENMVTMQAHSVLQDVYVKEARSQLQAAETRKNKDKGLAMDDGLPKLLTDTIYLDAADAREERKKERDQAKRVMADKRDSHKEALRVWKLAEKARVARNEVIRQQHRDAVKEWEEESKLAKAEKRRARWTKPKMGPLEKAVPKPVLYKRKAKAMEGVEESDEDSDEDGIVIDEDLDE